VNPNNQPRLFRGINCKNSTITGDVLLIQLEISKRTSPNLGNFSAKTSPEIDIPV
jgi:hypothetical protein